MSKLYQNCEITIVSEGGDLTLANIKSALKRAKTTRIRTARNAVDKSMMKTAIRHFETALEEGSLELAKEKLNNVTNQICSILIKGSIEEAKRS